MSKLTIQWKGHSITTCSSTVFFGRQQSWERGHPKEHKVSGFNPEPREHKTLRLGTGTEVHDFESTFQKNDSAL